MIGFRSSRAQAAKPVDALNTAVAEDEGHGVLLHVPPKLSVCHQDKVEKSHRLASFWHILPFFRRSIPQFTHYLFRLFLGPTTTCNAKPDKFAHRCHVHLLGSGDGWANDLDFGILAWKRGELAVERWKNVA